MEAPFTLTPLQQIWSWFIGQIWYILDILVSWLLRVWLTYYLFDLVVTVSLLLLVVLMVVTIFATLVYFSI